MTAAVRDLRGDTRSRRLLAISLAVLAVLFVAIAWFTFTYVRGLWEGRHDIAVDWDPVADEGRPYEPLAPRRTASPDGTRFVVNSQGRLLIAATEDESVLADMGDVDEVAWVTDDVLVVFGQRTFGGFEGLAVVDVADRTVEQIDTGGRTDEGFSPVAVTDDGLVEACEWVYDSDASSAACGPDRFLIEPATAELTPA